MIIDQFIDAAGKIRITWQMASGGSLFLKFSSQPTEEELLAIEAQYTEDHSDDDLDPMLINILENRELIKDFVLYLKAHPNITATQMNNVMSTKAWYEQVIIRTLVYYAGNYLAQRNDVVLSDYTEAQVFVAVRDWIVAKPIRRIARLLYGERRVFE
jgi:hypothetical protein